MKYLKMSNDITCMLCKNAINIIQYNIDEDYTKYSNLLLRTFLENVFEHKVILTSCLYVCATCVDILNELDLAESRYKRIRQKVLSYLDFTSGLPNKCNVYCQTDVFIENVLEYDLQGKNKNLNDAVVPSNCVESTNFISNPEDLPLKIEENEMKPEAQVKDNKSTEQKCLDLDDDDVNYEKNINEVNDCQDKDITIRKSNRGRKKKLPDVLKPYKCALCPKTWKTLGELRSHHSAHSDARPYICEICGQAYKHKSALDVHVGMHNGIYPFMCTYCKKSFTQKGALQRHLPIHTGETPYQCDLCGKRFVHHTSFNIHQLSHSGKKDYKCAQCGLALFSGSHLKRHMRVHSGERNYVCTFCGKRFAERYNLASHQKLHENPGSSAAFKRNHRCQTCGIIFYRRLKLDEHIAKEHQKVDEPNLEANVPFIQEMLTKTEPQSVWAATNYNIKSDIPGTSY